MPISAGFGKELNDRQRGKYIKVSDMPIVRNADFALRVHGDSMLPEYENGDIILVNKNAEVKTGDIGVFILNGDGYMKEAGNGELISLNPMYENIKIHEYDEVRVIGKVIGKL